MHIDQRLYGVFAGSEPRFVLVGHGCYLLVDNYRIDELLGLLVVGWIGSGAGCFGFMVWAGHCLGTGALAPIFFYK